VLLLTRPADAPRQTLDEYLAEGGYAEASADAILRSVAEADLRGRGGAGFPAARKWELARAAEGTPKYVVVNGGEHEPGSQKDRFLCARYPHRVLDGARLAAIATGASAVYLYLIEDMADAIEGLTAAIAEASAQLLGLDVKMALAPTTYVAGEESAALEVIEGRKAWPRKKPPYPGQAGLWGKPTTVNNVETLALVPAIVRGERALPMLFTLDASFARPGIHEVPLGTTFRALVDDIGGGTAGGRPVKAILPALSSAFLPASALDLPLTNQAVKEAGSNLGCGGVSLVEEGTCLVERALAIAEFFMKEQCGQCPPCRMETNTIAAVMKKVKAGEPGDYKAQIEKICAFAKGKGNCSLIEMAAAPALSAIRLFPEDFDHHVQHGSCK
jgi:NADH-quinone oxidoreductase subunit F